MLAYLTFLVSLLNYLIWPNSFNLVAEIVLSDLHRHLISVYIISYLKATHESLVNIP